jgi:hypothetical protein
MTPIEQKKENVCVMVNDTICFGELKDCTTLILNRCNSVPKDISRIENLECNNCTFSDVVLFKCKFEQIKKIMFIACHNIDGSGFENWDTLRSFYMIGCLGILQSSFEHDWPNLSFGMLRECLLTQKFMNRFNNRIIETKF